MWGFACQRISSGAPAADECRQHATATRVARVGGELAVGEGPRAAFAKLYVGVRVEYAVSDEGVDRTDAWTHRAPRSSTSGRAPARARTSAAKSPAGPVPTTTGRTNGRWQDSRTAGSDSVAAMYTSSSPMRRTTAASSSSLASSSVTPSVTTKWTLLLRRASTERLSRRSEATRPSGMPRRLATARVSSADSDGSPAESGSAKFLTSITRSPSGDVVLRIARASQTGGSLARHDARCPGPVQVEAAGTAVDVEHLARGEQPVYAT